MGKNARLATAFFLILAAANLALSLTLARESPLRVQARTFLSLERVDRPGDLIPMHQVLQSLRTGKERVYQEQFFRNRLKFIYPPTAMVFFHPFRGLSAERFRLLFADAVNRLFLLLGIACCFVLLRRWSRLNEQPRLRRLALQAAFATLLLTFYPFFKAFTLGQAQVWINSLMLLALVAALSGRQGLAGGALALCALIKPSYGLLLLWGVVRRRWRFCLVFVLVGAIGLGVSLSLYGWQNHADYLKVFRLIGQRGEGYYPNQSLNGLLNRALFNGNNISWDAHRYPPRHPAVTWGSTLFAVIMTLLGLWLARPRPGSADWLTLAMMLLCVSLAAPIAWEHSYGYTLPLFLFAMLAAFDRGRPDALRLALAVLAFLLASHFLHFVNLRFHATRLNVLQSYLFFAECILLALLAGFSRREQDPAPGPPGTN
jgi:hypothetical protein